MEVVRGFRSQEGRVVYGRHSVLALLSSQGRRVEELVLQDGVRGEAVKELETLARAHQVKCSFRPRGYLTHLAGTSHHQGVVARVSEKGYLELEELLHIPEAKGEAALFVVLDEVQDPQNLGNLLRSAEASGTHGVILPERRSAGLTGAVAKASAGAIESVPVARVGNLVDALEKVKKAGVWVVGASPGAPLPVWEFDLAQPVALVLGGEGKGLRPRVVETVDALVSLPFFGRVGSLNVAAAGAALLYEVLRQRARKKT